MAKNAWRKSAEKLILVLVTVATLLMGFGPSQVFAQNTAPSATSAQWTCGTSLSPAAGVIQPGTQVQTTVSCSKANPEVGYISVQTTGSLNITTWEAQGVSGCVKRQTNEVFCKNRDQGGTILRLISFVTAPSSGSFTQSGNYQIDEGQSYIEVKATYIVASDGGTRIYLPVIVR